MMMFGMIAGRENSKIGQNIICFVSVDMVNMFISMQSSAKMLFHDATMFKNKNTITGNLAVSIFAAATFAIRSFLAEQRIAISGKPKVMGVTESMTTNPIFTYIHTAGIWVGMLCETAARWIFLHAFHDYPPLASQYTADANGGLLVINWVNSGKLLPRQGGDNPERSRGYILGTCNDYRRGRVPLITGKSARLVREEIVCTVV